MTFLRNFVALIFIGLIAATMGCGTGDTVADVENEDLVSDQVEVPDGQDHDAADAGADAGEGADIGPDQAVLNDVIPDVGEDAADTVEDAAEVGEDAAEVGEDAAEVGEDAADIIEDAAEVGEDVEDVLDDVDEVAEDADAGPCTDSSQCPATGNPCTMPSCDDGECVAVPLPVDFQPLEQVPGDCQVLICDGNGGVTNVSYDEDVPDDENPCTVDLCLDGQPNHESVEVGTGCGDGLTCDDNGACTGCATADDCPGKDTECGHRTCDGLVCGFVAEPAGTQIQDQDAGDCSRAVCDGSGGIGLVPDDTDLPVDGKECTVDSCMAGVASNHPLDPGTPCTQGGGTKCDGSGACIQCQVASECGVDNACRQVVCNAGFCGEILTPEGEVVVNPVVGDCRSAQCDGNGNIVSDAPDDQDLPVDGKVCTQDVCLDGQLSNPPLPPGTPCAQNGGMQCDGDGNCVQCMVGSDCGVSTPCLEFLCLAGICGANFVQAGITVANPQVGDCRSAQCDGMGNIVPDAVYDTDLPVDGKECTQDVCLEGQLSNPPVPPGTPCTQSGGNVCDGKGVCVECLKAADCDDAQLTCINSLCFPAHCVDEMENADERDLDCGGSCPPCGSGRKCFDSNDCVSGVCADHVCS
ncbi:MAG TPA: hypothetical protein PLB35_08045 [Myxococcota bacterium]|nr:hypothetical protein [Myxococcota bacterium]HOH77191.1 hypothetical protein [Myxococcota bacterium]